jgi:hypothetical protein
VSVPFFRFSFFERIIHAYAAQIMRLIVNSYRTLLFLFGANNMRNDGFGVCESCHSNFEYCLIHNDFSDTAYAYCDTCGMTCLVGGWDDKRKPKDAPLKIQGPIQAETEAWLQTCLCGGRFRAKSSPRCPICRHALSAEFAACYIEKNAPGTKKGWRWQQNWEGVYCIVLAGRLVENNWRTQPEQG